MANIQIGSSTTMSQFEQLVDTTHQTIVQVGLASTTRDKVREDLLRRFATQQGMTYEQAEQLLVINENPPAATVVEPEIINVDPVRSEEHNV